MQTSTSGILHAIWAIVLLITVATIWEMNSQFLEREPRIIAGEEAHAYLVGVGALKDQARRIDALESNRYTEAEGKTDRDAVRTMYDELITRIEVLEERIDTLEERL